MSDQPRGSRKEGRQRIYSWREANYWSVTTIIDGAMRKFALEAWKVKATAVAAVTNRVVLNAFLARCTTPEVCTTTKNDMDRCEHCVAAIEFLKDAPYSKGRRAGDIGTAMHQAIEAYTLGKPMPPWSVAIAGRMRQFERFLTEWTPTYHLAEAVVYNRAQQYAGQTDAVLSLPIDKVHPLVATLHGWPPDRDPVLCLDYKSSERGVYPEVALQLAAYRNAEFVGLIDGSEQPMPATDGAIAMRLTDEVCELVPVVSTPDIFEAFLYCREVFRFSEVTARTVLYPALAWPGAKPLEVTA